MAACLLASPVTLCVAARPRVAVLRRASTPCSPLGSRVATPLLATRRSVPVSARRASSVVVAAAQPLNAAESSGLSQADPSRWITGLTPNSNVVRGIALAVTLAVFSQGKAFMTSKALSYLHLLAWATLFGSQFYTTFVAGIAMFKTLPRQTFRDVQEVLFPAYFQLSTLALALMAVLAPLAFSVTQQQWYLLGAAGVATLLNLFWLEPATTTVMKLRAELEKMSDAASTGIYPEGKAAQMKRFGADFGKFHGLSSVANLVALCAAIAYGWSL